MRLFLAAAVAWQTVTYTPVDYRAAIRDYFDACTSDITSSNSVYADIPSDVTRLRRELAAAEEREARALRCHAAYTRLKDMSREP